MTTKEHLDDQMEQELYLFNGRPSNLGYGRMETRSTRPTKEEDGDPIEKIRIDFETGKLTASPIIDEVEKYKRAGLSYLFGNEEEGPFE